MPIIEYPFVHSSGQSTWRPHLPIEVISPVNGYGERTYAPIDTGAKECYMPLEWLESMSLPWSENDRTNVSWADENDEGRTAVRGNVNLRIFKIKELDADTVSVNEERPLEINDVTVVFLKNLHRPRLGVKGFLEGYIHILNYTRKVFSIRIPRHNMACRVCKPHHA